MVRNFVKFSIERSSLNHIFLLFLVFLAVIFYRDISKEIFPPFQLDKISITGFYNGASGDVLDKMVVNTIEDDLKNISEFQTISTVIKNGSFSILADLKSDADLELVLNDVKDLISKTKRDLPSDMDEPIVKLVESVIPLAVVAIAGDKTTSELIDLAEILKSRLAEFKDLSDISLRGDSDEQLVMRLKDREIEGYSLQTESVISALQNLSAIFPIGTIKEKGNHLYISTINGEKDIKNIENTLLSINGKILRVSDIANVSFELDTPSEISHYNGLQNISININKAKTGNAIQLVKDIRELLKNFEEKYEGVKFDIYTDTSVWIKNRLNTVISNIIFGLFLVFVALLLSVNWGIAIVVAMGIPVSFFIGLISADLLGYSLNMLSLLGALIALGMLVDEAIVVAENIYRHMEMGKDRKNAIIDGATEMFPAVLTATLTTIFAFLPLLILTGEMGQFMKILPIIISILLISSLVEAFYFLPLHAQEFIYVSKTREKSSNFWKSLNNFYGKILKKLIEHKTKATILMFIGIIGGTIFLVSQSKIQLFPDFDTTQIYIKGEVNINNELVDTEKYVEKIEKILLQNIDKNEVKSVTSTIGMKLDGKNKIITGENIFQIFIDLHERAPDNIYNIYINPLLSPDYDAEVLIRNSTARSIADEVEKWIEPLKSNFLDLSVIVPGAGLVNSDVEISFSGKSEAEVVSAIDRVQNKMKNIKGVYNLDNDAREGETELKLRINEYGTSLGFNERNLVFALQPLYLQGEYNKMFNSSGLIRVKIERKNKDQFKKLSNLNITIPSTGQIVRLDEVADFIFEKKYAEIFKEDGEKIKTLFANLHKKEITSSELMTKLKPTFDEIRKNGVKIFIKGEQKENEKMEREISQAMIIAIFLIFLTLVWMFNSVVLPLIVIMAIPLSIFGVFIGNLVMGLNITMPGLIGIVGLAGVVVNDALIMVDFIKKSREIDEVVVLAIKRIRPIILTSVTTIIGLSTLIFFSSGQALILQPMAVSLGFGLLWATLVNLIFIPVFYSLIYRVK
jgi:multidrug efflux pump subunit AcrB